ncbi:MAG: hypothetical protein Q8P20_07380 [bacterium]|nr:hypothetical protein [bacterium]
MKKDLLKKIKLVNKLQQLVDAVVKSEPEKKAMIEGLNNLSEKQLFELLKISLKNPSVLNIIAKQALQKKIILNKQDKKAWMELLQKEEKELGKQFLKIMDEEVKKSDKQSLDEIRKTL